MSNSTERIDTDPADRKPARVSRARRILAICAELRRLSDRTDIHSHQIRTQLESELDTYKQQYVEESNARHDSACVAAR
ncbi:MAG: hypothetical protein WBV94_03975 [Blastocatellia bacterium]